MKKSMLLNGPLSSVIAHMGHTDGLVIADAGLPIPVGPERIDLAVIRGLPGFLEVLRATVSEMQVERAVIASEMVATSPQLYAAFRQVIEETVQAQGAPIALEMVPHEEFKRLSGKARAIVRSGECTAYANVMLHSGVAF